MAKKGAVKNPHRGLFDPQKDLEEYKQVAEGTHFSQYKNDLKSILAGQGLWLSSKALAVALVVFEVLLLLVGIVVYYWAKFT